MRQLILFSLFATLIFSCTQKDAKQKETETKEIAKTEKEAEKPATTQAEPAKETTPPALVLTPLTISGDIGHATFSQDGKTIFYYDAKSKTGKINLNGTEHTLTKLEGSYTLTGDKVKITTTKGKFGEMESDCAYGKALDVTIEMEGQTLKLSNVEVQDCLSMVQ